MRSFFILTLFFMGLITQSGLGQTRFSISQVVPQESVQASDSFAKAISQENRLNDVPKIDAYISRYASSAVIQSSPRILTPTSKAWASPDSRSKQLYFEDVNLERTGNNFGMIQPVVSGSRFLYQTATWPHKLGSKPAWTLDYSLGHPRPGNYSPAYFHRDPFSLKGIAAETLAVTGIMFGL